MAYLVRNDVEVFSKPHKCCHFLHTVLDLVVSASPLLSAGMWFTSEPGHAKTFPIGSTAVIF